MNKLNVDQAVLFILGVVVVVTVLLGWYSSPNWLWITLLAGAHMIQMAFTGFCPVARLLQGVGLQRGSAL